MSAAGTPSTDPWVILARERARYEEQFKSLKPNNGVITGDQAKGFFLQSQLPPLVLGQIWALADTDSDGKMDINEFSIACKLINLKLRGFEIPKGLPPSLLASLKLHSSTPPAIPPLPNTGLINHAPSRPEPPKVPAMTSAPQKPAYPPAIQPLIGTAQPMMSVSQPALNANVQGMLINTQPMTTSSQSLLGGSQPLVPGTQPPLMPGIQPPLVPGLGTVAPTGPPTGVVQPVNMAGGMISNAGSMIPTGIVPPMQTSIPQIQPMPIVSQPLAGFGIQPSMVSNIPPTGITSAASINTSINSTPLISAGPISPVGSIGSVGAPGIGPGATSTPRASVTSLERAPSVESSSAVEWSVPQQTKLKYTQIFNTMDRTRSGFLSGAQARNVMVQSKLPQALLAQIWALSDMDADGRLGCEEFVLAMHLCEQAQVGTLPPAKLPPDLVPPSFRRPARTASISSQGSTVHADQDPASTLLQTSFDDKRKENYEKGQAELERRRKALLDQQRKEAEERERKEREEQERKEKARQEAERKRLEDLEKAMREQQEKERCIEEERKRQAEQREAARKEMERQRQLEWEKQRLQELQQQRQREQENVLKLKAKNQSLTIELSSLNDQVKELSQKICDTRIGVSNVKSTIDGMRTTRDTQMQEMSQLKNKLKDQNAKLLALSQEKIKLEARNKINTQDPDQAKLAFENKEVTIKNLREKVSDIQSQIDSKMSDIENNNSQLKDLKAQMKTLVSECQSLYTKYEDKKNQVLQMKTVNKPLDYGDSWKTTDAWGSSTNANSDWPVENNWETDDAVPPNLDSIPGVHKYRAIYEFSARNNDEISFLPGDILHVPEQQTGEPGWLAGEINGKTGWFPESYAEPVDGVGIRGSTTVQNSIIESTKIEEPLAVEPVAVEPVTALENDTKADATVPPLDDDAEHYIANYPYQSQEPGDLTFNAGDIIAVVKKEGDWWTGKLNDNVGIFPSNYVQKVDSNVGQIITNQTSESTAPASSGVNAAAVSIALESYNSSNAQVDNEVSQINEKSTEKPFDASMTSNAQVVKGKKPEIASVIAPYQATSTEQLSLARGQLIMIRKKTDSGWWEGELQAKGRKRQVGWFPASYVKILNSSGKISGRTTPVSTTRMQQEVVLDKVIALYPYTAQNPDELSFLKDDIINVTAREEEAWWRGELNGVSGLFPSNYVAPLQQSQLSAENKKRLGAINELIQTEETYVNDMAVVHKVFEVPLRKSKVVSTKEIDEIFVNWQDILQCNKSFLEDLKRAVNRRSETIGDVICQHLPRMTAYIVFCGKQLDSAALLQELTESHTPFKELVKKCQNNYITKGMPLSSFLIKPMQRITKYPLLISKILENTDEDHADYKLLEEALRIAEKFLSCVNENVRLKENQERMQWLQQSVQNELNLTFNSNTNRLGPRQLLHFGSFTKLKTGKELLGFLFNDFFMLVQPSKAIIGQFGFQRNTNVIYKMYKQPILIQNLSVSRESSESVDQGTDSNRVIRLQDEKTGYKIFLLATTVHECGTWTKKIDNAKESFHKISQLSKQSKRRTLLNTSRYLWVSMLEATDVVLKCNPQTCDNYCNKKGKPHTENVYCRVSLGSQEQETDFAKDTLNNGNLPQNGTPLIPSLVWNCSMQFQLRNVNEESLNFVVLEHNPFSLDEFLGKAELKLNDIYRETQSTNGPIIKKLILHQVESGEITVKLDLHMFNNY
ncbi:intersectin-1 isoform X3 [Anthonomus grandis grandis]|uniref:intersectin-1 isoform X3 n=1 Tax=Anthonomus grandis grandis TaxID=2921223 RepID=UPI002165404E|nr:intersectin-1 isoform X3 [Anthonomus grandis grandis]